MTPGAAPIRLRLSRLSGFSLQRESHAANGRPAHAVTRAHGRLGNPFRVADHGRERAVELHRRWLAGASAAELGLPVHDVMLADWHRRFVLDLLPALRGYNLACTCPLAAPGEPDCCHAATLLALANPPASPAEPGLMRNFADMVTGPAPRGPRRA